LIHDEKAKVPAWRIHDLRHTGATHLREHFGVSSEVVSLLLGHTPPGPRVTRIYNRAEALPERRAALVAWGDWLERLTVDEVEPHVSRKS
jgi:integrase